MQIVEILKKIQEQSIGLTILYVEDDDEVRKSTLGLLNSVCPLVTTAENGAEGLELFKNGTFDIVISDINMPEMNGIEMIRKIKELNQDQNIIMVSGHNENEYLLQLIHLGISRFILKPLQTNEFLTVMLKVTENIFNAKQAVKIIEQEKVIQQQAKLAQMGEMIGMIAHQWRQPLNALGLVTQKVKLLNDRGSLTTEKLNKNVEQSMQLIQGMSDTINDFMQVVKSSSEKHPFNVLSMITKSESIISEQLNSKSIQLVNDVDPSLSIESYQNEWFHILINLISNACDAFEGKEIDKKIITIKALQKDGIFECSIKDNAGGIPEDIIDQIFNPYFTTKEQGKGTGIGLDMSKRIVEKLLEGELTVHNDTDGAVFTIKIKL